LLKRFCASVSISIVLKNMGSSDRIEAQSINVG
jgi:hypothetical protein